MLSTYKSTIFNSCHFGSKTAITDRIFLFHIMCQNAFTLSNLCLRRSSVVASSWNKCFSYKTLYSWLIKSHTRTVKRDCFKGDEASQWKRPKFDPSPHQNPLTDLNKNWQAWLFLDGTRYAKILSRSVQGLLFPKYAILPCFWGDRFLLVFWVLQ